MTRWSDHAARAVLPPGLRRRELLELVALIAALPACKRKEPAHSEPVGSAATDEPARALPADAYRALDAATARILPGDGTFPGAREAGVMTFIDRQLAIPPISRIAPALIMLARALDDAARARKAGDFSALAPAQQDELLDALARGTLGTKLPERELFRVLHGLVLEGFLADPHHGGNKDQVA